MNFELLKEKAKSKNITDIEIYSVRSKGNEIETFNFEIEKNLSFATNVMAIRGVYNDKITTIYLEDDSNERIDDIICEIIDNCSNITKDEPYVIYEGDEIYPKVVEPYSDYEKYSLEDKKNICLRLEDAIKKRSEYVTKTNVSYEEIEYEYAIINTKGLNVRRKTKRAMLVGEAILEKDGETKTNYDYDFINEIAAINYDELAKKIADRCALTFGAKTVDSKSYDVILENKVMASLLGEFSNIFSAKAVIRKVSFLEGEIDNKIFSDKITIVDDPLFEMAPTKSSFDDEGVAAFKKVVVDSGVLKTYLHNLSTAAIMKCKTTSNGFKDSVRAAVDVSPSNMYIKNGDKSVSEMYNMIDEGILITNVQGLHSGLDPVSGAFNLQASGFKIREGKLSDPVTLIIISGNFKDMLNNVKAVGSDFIFRGNFGSPSILITSMKVSGK